MRSNAESFMDQSEACENQFPSLNTEKQQNILIFD